MSHSTFEPWCPYNKLFWGWGTGRVWSPVDLVFMRMNVNGLWMARGLIAGSVMVAGLTLAGADSEERLQIQSLDCEVVGWEVSGGNGSVDVEVEGNGANRFQFEVIFDNGMALIGVPATIDRAGLYSFATGTDRQLRNTEDSRVSLTRRTFTSESVEGSTPVRCIASQPA